MQVVRGVVLFVGSLMLTSCSIIAVRGPPKPCTDDYLGPGVDTALAVLGVAVAAGSSSSEGDANAGTGLVGLMIIVAVPAAISAVVGFSKVSACRDDHEGPYVAPARPSQPKVKEPEPTAPSDPTVIARKRAWALYEEALRSHDCTVVRAEGLRIRALDSDFYRRQFLADERVRACFERPGADPPPAPVAPMADPVPHDGGLPQDAVEPSAP